MKNICPFTVGEIALFNPDARFIYSHPGIKDGEQIRIDKIGRSYTYYGLKDGDLCWAIDFTVLSSGMQYKEFSSQYFGPYGVEFE